MADATCVGGDLGGAFALQVEEVRAVGEVTTEFHPEVVLANEGSVGINIVSRVCGVAAILGVEPLNPY